MMASKPLVQQKQKRGEAVVDGEKGKQKVVRAGGNNRRALGDIQNLVQQQQEKINRPITRGFYKQLVANNVGNNNTKPEKVIETSKPDTQRVSSQRVSKKKVHSLTAVLTARSKAACGVTNKPKNHIVNIDVGDVDNQLAAVEYVEDLYKFYKPKNHIVNIDVGDVDNQLAAVEYVEDLYKFYKLEEGSSQVHDYMDSQIEINGKMRAILVDWLIEVHTKFELMPESLYLTINIVDRYLSIKTVLRRELQLVGMSAMLIASKYEEIWAPQVNDFVCISDMAYTGEQILAMEKFILSKLLWNLTLPTPYMFIVRFIKAAMSDQEMENMVFFFAELGLMHYATTMYCPSMLAASAVYAARCTLNKTPLWTETLKFYTGFSEVKLMDCGKLLLRFHSELAEHKLQVIYKKYSDPMKGAVALLPPAKHLLA